MNLPDLDDPQATPVNQAQTDVVLEHPNDDITDLAQARDYIAEVTAIQGVSVGGCYRAWRYQGGGDQMIVDRSKDNQDLAGMTIPHPADGTAIVILPWRSRYAHFDPQMNEIVIGGCPGRPISHRLLLVHEVSHVLEPIQKHGPVWVERFERMTARHLPHLAAELHVALRRWGVTGAP
jgi:hypothetical protein